MKRLLVLGASMLQLPAIKRAKELGYYVAIADYDSNAIGISIADEYYNVSTIDMDGVLGIAKRFKPDGIITLATDMPIRSVANATSVLGLPGISLETAIKSTDKFEMIKAFKENRVESPWYYIVDSYKEFQKIIPKLSYPFIIKPTDSAGSRGVILINNQYELKDAYTYSKRQSRSGRVIIEEYMRGHEVSVEVMTIDRKSYVLSVTDKITTGAPYFVEMGHFQQSQLSNEDIEKIKDLAKRAVEAVGINCGPAHVEIMLTKDGPKMIELGARMGGDYITTHLVPLSTGIDMVQAVIELSLGITPDIEPRFSKGSAIRFFNMGSGTIRSIEGIENAKRIKGIQEVTLTKSCGDIVKDTRSSTDRIGFIIAQAKDAQFAAEACEKAMQEIKVGFE